MRKCRIMLRKYRKEIISYSNLKTKSLLSTIRRIPIIIHILFYFLSVIVFGFIYNHQFKKDTASFIITTQDLNNKIDIQYALLKALHMDNFATNIIMNNNYPIQIFNIKYDTPSTITDLNFYINEMFTLPIEINKEWDPVEDNRTTREMIDELLSADTVYQIKREYEILFSDKNKNYYDDQLISVLQVKAPDPILDDVKDLIEQIKINENEYYNYIDFKPAEEMYLYIVNHYNWGKDKYKEVLKNMTETSIDILKTIKAQINLEKNDSLFLELENIVSIYDPENVSFIKSLHSLSKRRFESSDEYHKLAWNGLRKIATKIKSMYYTIQDFHKLRKNQVKYIDFLYFSFLTSTTSNFGYLAPNDRNINAIISFQILLSMFILGVIIDQLVLILKNRK